MMGYGRIAPPGSANAVTNIQDDTAYRDT